MTNEITPSCLRIIKSPRDHIPAIAIVVTAFAGLIAFSIYGVVQCAAVNTPEHESVTCYEYQNKYEYAYCKWNTIECNSSLPCGCVQPDFSVKCMPAGSHTNGALIIWVIVTTGTFIALTCAAAVFACVFVSAHACAQS